jgi:gluconate 2-dehydrogenase gamma chain
MNRRESLKAIGLSLSTTVLLDACHSGADAKAGADVKAGADGKTRPDARANNSQAIADEPGRQRFEVERDHQLQSTTFFTSHEMETITVLADLIIPKDEQSGSASDAKVPDFIEFIVKDEPEHQLIMRGGLRWLDVKCLYAYNNEFKGCSPQQQKEMLDQIAFPMQASPEAQPGVAFFNKMRDLTAIGFFTSKMGIADLGYKGNSPGKWEGVPKDVLKQYGLENV